MKTHSKEEIIRLQELADKITTIEELHNEVLKGTFHLIEDEKFLISYLERISLGVVAKTAFISIDPKIGINQLYDIFNNEGFVKFTAFEGIKKNGKRMEKE